VVGLDTTSFERGRHYEHCTIFGPGFIRESNDIDAMSTKVRFHENHGTFNELLDGSGQNKKKLSASRSGHERHLRRNVKHMYDTAHGDVREPHGDTVGRRYPSPRAVYILVL